MVLHAGGDFSRNFFLVGVHRLVAIRYHLQAPPGSCIVDQPEIMTTPDGLGRRGRIQSFIRA